MDGDTMKLVSCRFKLPLAYNDGLPVAQDRLDEQIERVFVEFGGLTVEGTETGHYRREDTGERQIELMLRVQVAVPSDGGVDRLRILVAEIGGELDQETMFLEVSADTQVELVPSTKRGGH